MTRFQQGQDVAVVEHDPDTRKPREGGRFLEASVTNLTPLYVQANIEGYGVVTFWRESGWTAWTGNFGWRLVPICTRCDDPVLEAGTDGLCVNCRGDEADRQWERAQEG